MEPAAADTGPTVTSSVAVYAEDLLTNGPVSDEPDADSAAARNDTAGGWRLAAAAARIGSISMHWHIDLTSSNERARDTALGVLSSEPLSQGRILDIIEGGIGTWDEPFLTAVAALTVQQPTLDISKSSLLRLTREADYRGCAAEARRLLQRLPDAKSAELSAAELASIILLSRRHQLRGLIGRCARGSAFNRDVIDLLGVEDVLWLMEHSGLSQKKPYADPPRPAQEPRVLADDSRYEDDYVVHRLGSHLGWLLEGTACRVSLTRRWPQPGRMESQRS